VPRDGDALRGDSDCYGYANIHACSYANTQRYTNSDSHSYRHIHDYAERYGDSYSYAYSQANAHRTAQRDAEATSHPGTAPEPVAVIWFKERRSLVRRPKGADWKPPLLECWIDAIGPIVRVLA
jgi:hypothetical protein